MLEHSVENIPVMKSIFETAGDTYRFMEGYPKKQNIYTEHLKKRNYSGKTVLCSLSVTKWSSYSDNLDRIVNVYPAFLSMFQQTSIESQNDVAIGFLV